MRRTIVKTKRASRPPREVASLVARAATGEDGAWDDLVHEFGGLVWAVARAHGLRSADAADVAQATWTRLAEHLDRLDHPGRLGRWLAATARQECLRALRQGAPVLPQGGDLPGADHDDATLWSAFAAHPPRERALLRMLAAHPRPSYAEIAAGLDMPIGSIGPTRARALERLRRRLQDAA
jgi:RNA polymerase sigma factor (sigma-70 family)